MNEVTNWPQAAVQISLYGYCAAVVIIAFIFNPWR